MEVLRAGVPSGWRVAGGVPLNLARPSPLSGRTSHAAGPLDCMLPLFIPAVGHVLNEVFEGLVESSLQQPTFVLDHPLEISPLVGAGWEALL